MPKDDFIDLHIQEKKLLKYVKQLKVLPQEKIRQALEMAKQGHSGQSRDEGGDYVIHPVRTAIILLEELEIKNEDLLAASLLHDVIEDSELTLEDIKLQFGLETARIVDGATRPRPVNETEKQKAKSKIEKIQKIAQADEDVRLVKLCDVLDNARSQNYIPKSHASFQKIPRWNREFQLYLPIAKNTSQRVFQLLNEYVRITVDKI